MDSPADDSTHVSRVLSGINTGVLKMRRITSMGGFPESYDVLASRGFSRIEGSPTLPSWK